MVIADGEDEILGGLERQQAVAHAEPAQALGHRLQHHVADFAAQRVRHQLQAAELHVRDRVRPALLVQLRGECARIEQTGRRVVGGVVRQIALVSQTLADVLGQHQAGLAAVEIQPRQMRTHFKDAAVLALVQADLRILHVADARLRDRPADLLPTLARADVQDAHRQELIAAVAVLAHCRFVDLQEAQRVRIEHPERRRIAVEQQPELALGLLHPGQRIDPLADIGQRADHAALAVHHRHALAACGNPAGRATRQHQAEHLIEHTAAGKGGIEGLLHARGVVVVHAREEIRDGQALDVDAENLTGQRRPAQQAGILVHVPGTHLADLVGHAQLGMAGAQFLAQAVLVAGGAAQADIHRGKQRPVQQVDPDRGLHIRPPGRQHIAPAQSGVDRQRVLGQRAQAGDALDAIHGTGLGAQRGQCVAAQQLAFGQPEATPRHGAGIRAARQHVAMRVGDRDHPGIAGIHAADDGLQFRRAQPCQQPAVTAHRQRQRQDPVRGIQRLRRPEENLAAQAAIAIHRPQR